MDAKHDGPIEVWLSQDNLAVTCRIVYEDESTTDLTVDSLTLRGAQREMTGYLIGEGFKPVGRWEFEGEAVNPSGGEVSRKFVPAKKEASQT